MTFILYLFNLSSELVVDKKNKLKCVVEKSVCLFGLLDSGLPGRMLVIVMLADGRKMGGVTDMWEFHLN